MTLVSDPKQLSPDLQDELRDFLMALADTKHALGLRYAEWSDRGPRLEAAVAASAMAQDQLGQARVLYALIQESLGAPENFDDETRPLSYSLACLDAPFEHWSAFVAANLLIGGAITTLEHALAESRLAPLRARIPKMLEEERFHHTHAEGWFNHLLKSTPAVQSELANSIRKNLAQVLCWFGDAQHDALAREQIVTATPAELRDRYLKRMAPLIAKSDARELLVYHASGDWWSYVDALPWGRFDPRTRRVQ